MLRGCQLFRAIFREISEHYPDVNAKEAYIDAFTMWLVRDPEDLDVVVLPNMFGDIATDLASVLQGGMGMAASANLGDKHMMFEPVHGSAPDIAGKNIANPIATILSLSMALRYSLDLDKEASQLDKAVQNVLDEGLRTKDIMSKNMKEVSTSDMGDAIISKLK